MVSLFIFAALTANVFAVPVLRSAFWVTSGQSHCKAVDISGYKTGATIKLTAYKLGTQELSSNWLSIKLYRSPTTETLLEEIEVFDSSLSEHIDTQWTYKACVNNGAAARNTAPGAKTPVPEPMNVVAVVTVES